MTAEEFRQVPELMTWLRALLESENMKIVMEVLAEEGPEHYDPPPTVTPHYAHIMLGKSRGYAAYPDAMKRLVEPQTSEPDIESNYQE